MLQTRKKNCLSCAFCTRNQDRWVSAIMKWRYSQVPLSGESRTALKKGDETFIGQALRDQIVWDETFAVREAEEKERVEKNPLAKLIMGPSFLEHLQPNYQTQKAEKFGMDPRPSAPDEDYLSCFHEQWDEKPEPDHAGKRKQFLERTVCAFFYPYEENSDRSLEAYEKTRKAREEKRRYQTTNILVIVGIVITIAIGVLGIPRERMAGLGFGKRHHAVTHNLDSQGREQQTK